MEMCCLWKAEILCFINPAMKLSFIPRWPLKKINPYFAKNEGRRALKG